MVRAETTVPDFDDLPELGGLRHSWGIWGENDRLGAVNLITPERTLAASRLIQDGVIVPLDWSLRMPRPPLFGRAAYQSELERRSPTSQDEYIHQFNAQSSSQWDGFRHVRSVAHGYYNGREDEDHGVEFWADHGLVTRAVLADVQGWRRAVGRPIEGGAPDPISASDITSTLSWEGVTLQTGDVLLVRSGWIEWYLRQGQQTRDHIAIPGNLVAPGLKPDEETARFLWNSHVAAVAVDNPAMEVWPLGYEHSPEDVAALRADPAREHEIQLHIRVIPMLGILVGELFFLERLAVEAHLRRRFEFFFSSAPLHLPGGVATPPNAIVVL